MKTLTEEEKRAECLRICGPGVTPEMHRMAPEMCPILLDWWKNPSLKPSYRKK
jgi:hypothetical protein